VIRRRRESVRSGKKRKVISARILSFLKVYVWMLCYKVCTQYWNSQKGIAANNFHGIALCFLCNRLAGILSLSEV